MAACAGAGSNIDEAHKADTLEFGSAARLRASATTVLMNSSARIVKRLFALLLLLGAAFSARAEDCSDYPGGIIDGDAGTIAPAQLKIDRDCRISNYPASNPLTTNFSFLTQPGQNTDRWLVVFDNVVHTGQMSCNLVSGHIIWFTNGSSSKIQDNCQNLLIPVEKIDKQNPAGQSTAIVGVPFTYSLTMPVLYDAGTGTVINDSGSLNQLHDVTLIDDLNTTGAALTYVSHIAYWEGSGTPVPHWFSNVGGVLTFDNFPNIPTGEQVVIELTVVLDATPANTPGTQFVNTAKWDFGRLIDGVFYDPLPGEWGITLPMTIAAPELVLTKTGPATLGRTLNLGEWGDFGLDIQNTGFSDAWNATILDRLPDGATGGMCNVTPEVLSAQVFAADGITPVPGKGPLTQGVDFSFNYDAAPACELTLNMLTAAAVIGPNERLIIDYRTRLDADSQDGATLTNVAGATLWFSGDTSDPNRVSFVRALTDGTAGLPDHEDAHTVIVALFGYFFEKTVANLTSGVNPATTATAGDTLRYTLRLQTTDGPLNDLTFYDDLGALNALTVFEPGTLTLVPGTIPPGADTSNTDPFAGTNGAGILDVRNLNLPADSEISLQFDITLNMALLDGTVVSNQADLLGTIKIADSDDPNINGQADPSVAGDEDPTQIVIEAVPPPALLKENTQTTATVGEQFSYLITVPTVAHTVPLYDVRILDDLAASAADLQFVSVTKVSGSAPWTPVNTGTATNLVIEDPVNGIDIPAGEQAVVEITVLLLDTVSNVAGLEFTNTAAYTYNQLDNNGATELPGDPGTTGPMTIVEPQLTLEKSGPLQMRLGLAGTFTLDIHNTGGSPAYNLTITDILPNQADGGMCDAAPVQLTAQLFEADGVTAVAPAFSAGTDFSVSFAGDPLCTLSLSMLTAATAIGPDQRLIVNYQASLDAGTQDGATLTNVAAANEWFSDDTAAANDEARTYTRVLTDGTVGVLDHEDAHTAIVNLTYLQFEKTVANLTRGDDPGTLAFPGETLRYSLYIENTTNVPLSGFSIVDELDALNAVPSFQAGTLNLVTVPAGADTTNTDPTGGAAGTGLLDVRNLDIGGLGDNLLIEFEVVLAPVLANGSYVSNQSDLIIANLNLAASDDPNINGPADPIVDGDEDPTQIVIEAVPPPALLKENTQTTATVGEQFSYLITVPTVAHTVPLYDVRILDDLAASAADLQFVSVTKVSGSAPWTPVNTGTATNLVIEDPVNGIDIPAGEQAVVEITVLLLDTVSNVAGLEFTNTAAYTYNQLDNNGATELPGDPGTTGPMTIVEPQLTLEKSGPLQMRLGLAGTFTLDIHNTGGSPAYNLTITDILPNQADGGMCDAAPVQLTAQLFEADGVTAVAPAFSAGTDFSVSFAGDPLCTLSLSMLTAATAIGPDQRLIVNYQASLDAGTQDGATLTNVAAANEWFSDDTAAANDEARTYTRVLTDGTVGVLDHEDAHTAIVNLTYLQFEKTVANLTRGDDPGTLAFPGETLRYSLYIENTTNVPLSGFSIVDELDALNAVPSFQAGTLNLVTVPAGADTTNTDPTGGAAGTGLLDVRNLDIGGLGDNLLIEFEVVLAPVLANGSYVSNQSDLIIANLNLAASDDPNINGPADPIVDGDEDPTQILIESAPYFSVEKISSYITGDPAVLLAGETLRYTITVRNIGTDNATGAELADQLPANTTYVPGSTTLNGVAIPDSGTGGLPLVDGILINAPQDTTPGVLNVAVADNVATIVFDVVVYPDAPDGTIISNQAFGSAVDHGIPVRPSDDPRTATVDDPTMDVVGNLPLLFAAKSAALQVDAGSPGIVDPGDVLRYTITIYNNGSVPATVVELIDNVPADTTYVADTVTLNGLAVGQPDSGVFPLAARIPVSSADLTPPLPGIGEGTLSPGQSAVVQFDLLVNAAVATGSLITNQAIVYSEELPNLLTDGDGNPATGPEPTVVVVGDAQQLSIIKAVSVVDGGPALAGATLEYVVTVRNVASVPAYYVVITDDLDAVIPGYLTYVNQSATMNGLTGGVSFAGTTITADYFAGYGPLAPDETVVLRFRAVINPNLADGTTITNIGGVSWNDPQQWAEASVSIDVGATPGAGMLSGNIWHDADHDNTPDGAERPLGGWTVELLRDDQPIRSMLTDAEGNYTIIGVTPNYATGEIYALRFSAPGAVSRTALLGRTDSDFTDGLQRIDEIEVQGGSNLLALNMPVDPNGVVYDSIARSPIAGATVTLVDSRNGAPLPGSCFDDPNQQDQVTIGSGYYKFDINFSNPACPSGISYSIQVIPPGSSFDGDVSELIPPASDQTTLPFDVPACSGSTNDAVLATAQHCEAQVSEFAPTTAVPARSAATDYHLFLRLNDVQVPGSSQMFNNHVPLDPRLDGAVSVSKTTPMLNVTRGQMVPYVITIGNSFGVDLQDVTIVDRLPAGFHYVEGSARFDDVKTEPAIVSRELIWSNLSLASDGRHTIRLLLVVGAGVTEGEFVNLAQAVSSLSGTVMSKQAAATVRLVPDPTFDCTDVSGKVFDDSNRNGYQDDDEAGLAGVRVVTAKGLAATTDTHGRYHYTCAITPNENRGSNFVLKLDDRTLPSGFRPSTRPVQVQRATRGKALRINFGASIHRVVGLDIADAVFEPGSVEMRSQWRPRVGLLLQELQKGPAVLRLSYVADVEAEALVERRLEMIKDQIMAGWADLNCCYELVIEPEIYWRLGSPPARTRGANR